MTLVPLQASSALALRRLRRGALAGFFLFIAATVAGAQPAPPVSWKLDKVEAPAVRRFTPEQVLTMSGLQLGQTVGLDAVDAAMARLSATGYFTSVGYRYKYVGDKLTVIFNLEEAKWNAPVVFDNFVWFSDDELTNAVRQAVPNFDGTAPTSGGTAERITAALEGLLKEKKIEGHVDYQPAYAQGSDNMAHVFSVKDVSIPICAVSFSGAAAVSESDLIKKSKGLIKADYSRSYVADFVKDNLVPVYRERGYLKVRFGDAQARPETSDCKNGVHVTLAVTEGAVYAWDKVEWSGNSAFANPMLDDRLSMEKGEVANGLKIDEGFKTIKTDYGKKGYILSKLNLAPNFDEANHRVGYRVVIDEGAQYHMGSLSFTGLSESHATRLRRAWTLREGAVYNASYLDEYMRVWLPPEEPLRAKLQNIPVKLDRQRLVVDVNFSFK
jgi:outer membrane protein assembly factor BamA